MTHRYAVFHGTSLCEEDIPYSCPRHDVSIFDASFFSTHMQLAMTFAQSDSEIPVLPIVLVGEQRLKKPYIIRGNDDAYTRFNIGHPDPLEMRQQLFSQLRKEYDGLVYHDQHDKPFEIVAFTEDTFHLRGAMVYSGKNWSREISFEQLERVFESWKKTPEIMAEYSTFTR